MKKPYLLLTLVFSTLSIGLSACSNNAETGAVIGSLVGAGIGKSTANHHDKRALVGAVLGGIVGGAIGEEEDRKIAAAHRGSTSTQTAQNTHSHSTQREVVYVERPYYGHRHQPSIIIRGGYHHPRRHYRHRYHNRHHNRHHYKHHNRHRNGYWKRY